MSNSPFIRDVPAAQALDAWRDAIRAAGCPARLPAVTVPVTEAAGLVTAAPVWAVRSSPPFDAAGMDDGGRAELRAAVAPYQHVRSIGEDVAAGELLLPEGHRLRTHAPGGRRGGRRRGGRRGTRHHGRRRAVRPGFRSCRPRAV
jgi:putative molybdopterin biosynthesis protein